MQDLSAFDPFQNSAPAESDLSQFDPVAQSAPTEQPPQIDARYGLRRAAPVLEQVKPDYSNVGDFEAGVGAGVQDMKSMWNSFLAATGQAVGNDDLKAYGLKGMQENQAAGDLYRQGRTSQVEGIDGAGDFLDYAQYTLGTLAPFALESVLSAVAGAVVGSSGAPGAGTVVGGIGGFFAKKQVKDAIRNYVKGQVKDAAEEVLAKQAMARAGAATGALIGGYPLHVGDAYNETVEAGDPNAGAAFAAAVPMAALDAVVPAGAVGRALGAGKGGTMARAAKGVLQDAPMEGLTELGQEEVLLQMRGALDPEFDAAGEEADSRRLNAGVAGALGGAASGGASGAISRAEQTAAPVEDAAPADLAQFDPFTEAYDSAYPVEDRGEPMEPNAGPQRLGLRGVFDRVGRQWNETPEPEPVAPEPRGLLKIMANKPAAMREARGQRVMGEVQRSAVPYRPVEVEPAPAAEAAPYDNFVEYQRLVPADRTEELAGKVEQAITDTSNAYGRAARSGRLPEGLRDGRLLRMQFRGELDNMAKSLVKGGDVSYVRDANDQITGRTPSVNPDWFKAISADPDLAMSTDDAKNAVDKALKAERLGVRQARVVGAMLDQVTGRREDYARKLNAQREAVREARKVVQAAAPLDSAYLGYDPVVEAGEVYDESDYQAEAAYVDRTLAEMADDALNAGASYDDVESQIDNQSTVAAIDGLQQLILRMRNEHRQTVQRRPAGTERAPDAARSGGGETAAGSVETEAADTPRETETAAVDQSQEQDDAQFIRQNKGAILDALASEAAAQMQRAKKKGRAPDVVAARESVAKQFGLKHSGWDDADIVLGKALFPLLGKTMAGAKVPASHTEIKAAISDALDAALGDNQNPIKDAARAMPAAEPESVRVNQENSDVWYRGTPDGTGETYGGNGLVFLTKDKQFAGAYGQVSRFRVGAKNIIDASTKKGQEIVQRFMDETGITWAGSGTDEGTAVAWTVEREFVEWLDKNSIDWDGIYFAETATRSRSLAVKPHAATLIGPDQPAASKKQDKIDTKSDRVDETDKKGRFTFAGTRARNADTSKLESARQRIESGEDRETVRQETGWFKWADGKWRFEIDDSKARFKGFDPDAEQEEVTSSNPDSYSDWIEEAAGREGGVPLSQVLHHPALFEAYPQAAAIRVIVDRNRSFGGFFAAPVDSSARAKIVIGDPYNYPGGTTDALEVLLHEVQHAIQTVEGFASGGTEKDAIAERDAARKRMEYWSMVASVRQAAERDHDGNIDKAAEQIGDLLDTRISSDMKSDALNAPSLSDLHARAAKADREFLMASRPRDFYTRLAGEVEARNVEKRRAMSADSRVATRPAVTQDVADYDVIVRWNGLEMSSAALSGKDMTVEDVESAIAKRVLQFQNRNITVRVVPDAGGLPDAARYLMEDRGDQVAPRGYFHADPDSPAVYLVASELRSADEALAVLEHEAVGHLAVEAMLGADFKPFIERVNWLYKHGDRTIREAARQVAADYGADWKNMDAHDQGAEIVAKLAELRLQGSDLSKRARDVWTQIVQAVRQFFESVGFTRTFSENDVAFVLLKADAFLRTEQAGKGGRGAGAFSKGSRVHSVEKLIAATKLRKEGNHHFLDYRPVSELEAGILREKTGLDLEGFTHSIDEAGIRHILKEHGNAEAEIARGNLPLTEADIASIPHLIASADIIVYGGKSPAGLETIVYSKMSDGIVYVVEEVRGKRKKLSVVTLYKQRVGRSPAPRATSEDGDAHTSETFRARDRESMTSPVAAGKPQDRSRALESQEGPQRTPETLPARDGDSVPPKGKFSKAVAGRQQDLIADANKGMPVDRAFRKAFDIAGLVGEDGTFKAPAKAKELAAAISEAGGNLYQNMPWAHQWVEAAKRGLIDRYGLDADYRKLDDARNSDERRLLLKAHTFLQELNIKGVDNHEEAKVLHAVLTGKEVGRADLKALAQPIREAIDEMGAEAVQLGLISQDAYDRNAGAYLHRSYMKHEDQGGIGKWASGIATKRRRKIIGNQLKQRGLTMDVKAEALGDLVSAKSVQVFRAENGRRRYARPGADSPGAGWTSEGVFEVRRNDKGQVSLWRDWSEDERQSMGEILDARYAIAKTYRLMAHDLAVGRFYKSIAANADWCKAELDEGDTEATRTGRFGALMDDGEWVRVPDVKIPKSGAKRWGALAGKYVRAEIWRDLNEVEAMNTPGFWQKLMTQWKLNKTARNPVVHLNNVMSNLMFMDMADVRMRDLHRALQSLRDKDQDYQDALEHGAFGSGFIDHELRRKKLDEILAEIKKDAVNQKGFFESNLHGRAQFLGKMLDTIWGGGDVKVGGKVRKIGVQPADQAMLDAYQMEDEVFRMALFLRRKGLGDTAEVAAQASRDQFLNYDIRAPLINLARQSVLPFIGYTYRAVPIIAKSLAARPWKIAKYIVVAEGVNALGYALAPGDEDEERRSLREDQQGDTLFGTPRMIRMPWRDGHGDPVFLDVRRWIPAGDVFDTNVGQAAIPIPAPLQWSGPLMLAAELMLNKQGFTGQEIVNHKTDSAGDQASKVADWAWKSWMPSAVWVPNSWYWEKMETAIEGGRDAAGRTYSVPLALASSFGLKVQPHNVEQARMWQAVAFDQVERGLKAEERALKRLQERSMISSAEYQQDMAHVRRKMRLLQEERRETLNGK